MERFPEPWLWEPLDGPFAFEGGVPYIDQETEHDDKNDGTRATRCRSTYQCMLCETGRMNSDRLCRQHVAGKKHQRAYQLLKIQQRAWWQEEIILNMMAESKSSCHLAEEELQDDEDTLSYIMPFRRWQYGQWRAGMSCQLCGTAALPTRLAVAQHCSTSKRHGILRSATFLELHDECQSLLPQIQKLPPIYQWHVERAMIQYVALKEASFAGLASRKYAWYQLRRVLETYELRRVMVYLELAVWKQSMLHYGHNRSFETLDRLNAFLGPKEQIKDNYKQTKRVTCGISEIVQAVIPFLRSFPAL